MYSTSFILTFALITSTLKISSHLFILRFTVVQAGHLTLETASFNDISFVISNQSTSIIKSHHLSHALKAGESLSGDMILKSHGVSISTYAQIHSNSHENDSIKSLASLGGKYVV